MVVIWDRYKLLIFGAMQHIKQEEINSLIYFTSLSHEPSRYELVRFSTWRIYFYQELESMPRQKIEEEFKKSNASWIEKFPHLNTTDEEQQYYTDLLNDMKAKTYRQDIISHFGCRLLYCHDSANHAKFVEMQRLLFSIRMKRRFHAKSQSTKIRLMNLLKKMLAYFLQKNFEDFNVNEDDWKNYSHKIMHSKNETIYDYAQVPVQFGEIGLRKRYCFVRKGYVFLTIDCMIDLVESFYGDYLKSKMQKMMIPVIEMLNNDVQNQMSGFIRKTLQTLNSSNFDETIISNQHKLTLKNIDMLWKKFFPPCMQHLNKRLKDANHLKHEGRRQLWLFFKGCGMDVSQNSTYFQKHFASKVSNSDLKSHIYNIQHAYGLVGKKQPERPKNCRNIITGPAPKKDEYHGCPFAHWRKEQLRDFLRKNYDISQQNLQQVLRQKQQNHFQVACGRLFQGVAKSQGFSIIPGQITNLLGKSPHQYFQARMELANFSNKAQEKKVNKSIPMQKNSIEF